MPILLYLIYKFNSIQIQENSEKSKSDFWQNSQINYKF